jgi:ADP-ribosyl-[dinitrogen reductase] hydrolase
MPFETLKPSSPTLRAWDGKYGSSEYHGLGPGQWTDDTQMSMALAETLIKRGFYEPSAVAAAYLRWFQSGDCRGIGGNTRDAMLKLAGGAPWYGSGIVGAEGNGTAMRAAPLGLQHWRGIERLKAAAHWARIDSAITHVSNEAKEGSAAIAVAVSHLSSGGTQDTLLNTVLAYIEASHVQVLIHRIKNEIECCAGIVDLKTNMGWDEKGVSAHVTQTVPAALAMFCLTRDYYEAVHQAILLGGDTDTVGAITGALAGAYYGKEGLPEELLAPLERASDIAALDRALYT